jgi:SWIM zinc finger
VLNETKEYAVVVSDSGKCFCSCHDRFVNENICKHILMVIFERLFEIYGRILKEGGVKRDEGSVPNT